MAAAVCPGIVPHPPQCSSLLPPMLQLARSQKIFPLPVFPDSPSFELALTGSCLTGNAPEMCHLWSMKPKQIFDMGHFRETTQQFLRFKSSPLDVGVQKLQQWARLTQYFYPLGNFGASSLPARHFTFRITRPNPTFACSSIREESGIAFRPRFCQTWTSSLFAISDSFWLSKLDHKQHFWAAACQEADFSNHILQPNCRGRTTKCVGETLRQKCPIFILI